MKLNKISTLWEFMPTKSHGYNIEDTLSYYVWAIIFAIGLSIIIHKNWSWFYTNYSIFTIKVVKQSLILWLSITPLVLYFSVNEIYNKYSKKSHKNK